MILALTLYIWAGATVFLTLLDTGSPVELDQTNKRVRLVLFACLAGAWPLYGAFLLSMELWARWDANE